MWLLCLLIYIISYSNDESSEPPIKKRKLQMKKENLTNTSNWKLEKKCPLQKNFKTLLTVVRSAKRELIRNKIYYVLSKNLK